MSAESTISVSAPVLTLINVFTVEPARQQELVALPVAATEEIMQHQPGFISANIHASADGERIVNYSQRESEQAFQAMWANPQVLKHIADHHGQIDVEETLSLCGPVFVTGVAGLLGSHLAEAFVRKGREVRAIDNMLGGREGNVPSGVDFRVADCRNVDAYSDLLNGVVLVYHCAAAPYEGVSVFSPYLVHEHTCSSTIAVLSAATAAAVRRFVLCSSMARYGAACPPFTEDMTPAPLDPYGIAKYAAEMTVRSICGVHGMEFNIAVPHNVIGPRQRFDDPYRNVAAIMINRMLRGLQPLVYGDGLQRRCFSFVADVVSCLVALGTDEGVRGEVVNIGPDEEPITILELAQMISEIIGMPCDPIFVPARPLEIHQATCSSDKARRLLGYRTQVCLREGLRSMVEWIAAQGPRDFDYHLPLEIVTERTPATWTQRLV